MRQISDFVTQFPDDKRYYLHFEGDEILLQATTDEEAKVEGEKLLAELRAASGQ